MKIYTEIVWQWDEAEHELVEISSKSEEYFGPVALFCNFTPPSYAHVKSQVEYAGKWLTMQNLNEDKGKTATESGGSGSGSTTDNIMTGGGGAATAITKKYSRRGKLAIILAGAMGGVGMETIKKRRMLGSYSEKMGQY